MTTKTIVDFVAKGPDEDQWRLVLVEKGPWLDTYDSLQKLQDRLYDCVDALIDGQLIRQFPDIHKKSAVIQVDAYNVGEHAIQEFFSAFSNNVLKIDDYKTGLEESLYTDTISFILNIETFD